MKTVPLGDVASFIRGVTFKPSDVLDRPTETSVGIMRTKNVQAELDTSDILQIPRDLVRRPEQYLRSGDVLVSSANSWNLVGRCSWVPELAAPAAIGGFVTALRVASDQLEPKYLYRWFSSPHTQAEVRNSANQTTNIANLNLKRCEALKIPLPPLDEQRRIAAVLDHADDLRTKQRSVIAELDHLTRVIFEAVFRTGPSRPRWPTVRLGEVVPTIDSGTSPVCESRKAADGEWGILKLGAISYGVFNPEENKAFLGDPASIRKVEVQSGDLLFSRKNTKELVGATAVVYGSPPLLLLPDLIFRLNLDRDRVDAEYLHALLRSPTMRPAVVALASGSASSMSNISKARLVVPSHEVGSRRVGLK